MQKLFSPKTNEFVFHPPAAIRVHESVSPAVKNRSHELIAEVNSPEGETDGMLVTAGGRTAGYALFVKNGRLTYVYNYIGIERTVLTSTEMVPAGKSTLRMKFTKTGNFEGDVELYIDGQSVGKTHLARTVPATFSIEETFDVGEDTGSPVIEDVYAVPFRSRSLQKLTVRLGDD
jgi:arylsulfatase